MSREFDYGEFDYGKFTYDAYVKAVGGLSWNGEKLKEYNELPDNIKEAWKKVFFSCVSFTDDESEVTNVRLVNHLLFKVELQYEKIKKQQIEIQSLATQLSR